MPSFSETSAARLATCHSQLQAVCNLVIPHYDLTIISGHRTQEQQNQAYEMGYSQVLWPDSKHNKWPSQAVDVAPWPIDWQDENSFYLLAGRMLMIADSLGVQLRWGGDWDMDDDLDDQTFFDLGHFEVLGVTEGPTILYAENVEGPLWQPRTGVA